MVNKVNERPSEKRRPSVCVVMPCYKTKSKVLSVIEKINENVDTIYVVDDKCPDNTGHYVQDKIKSAKVKVIYNKNNLGVGGATIAGYLEALKDGFEIIVKLDSDGQMDPDNIDMLIRPLVSEKADYAKGNRFYLIDNSRSMPFIRRVGNLGLSFITKLSSGYWTVFDPTNGFTAIHRKALQQIRLESVSNRFFFESDLLLNLRLIHAVVVDVPIKAIYDDEVSNLSVGSSLVTFFCKNIRNILKRIIYQYFLHDFNPGSMSMVLGVFSLIFSAVFGGYNFYNSIDTGIVSSSGTVMISSLPLFFAIQFFVSFFNYDYASIPKFPLQTLIGD